MKRLLLALLFVVAHATAQPLALQFDRIGLVQFGEATFKAILKEDFIVDPQLVEDSRRVTVNVANIERAEIRPLLERVLLDAGIQVERRNGINWLTPAKSVQAGSLAVPGAAQGGQASPTPTLAAERATTGQAMQLEAVELYRPRFRPVEQLQRVINGFLGTSFADAEFVVLAAQEKRRKAALALLEQYDVKPLEIVARAAVIEYSEENEQGFSFKTAFSAFAGKLSLSYGASPMGNFITFKNSTIEAVLSALEGDSRFALVSQPTLRIANGAQGRFTVGSDVPVLDSVQTDKNGNPVQSITYRQSGVIFSLKPVIMRDRVQVEVWQQLSNFQRTSTSSIDSPTLLKRELQTTVGLESGDIIVLAGLEESKDTSSHSGFSFLPDFMKTTKRTDGRTQLLLVLEVQKVS
ncbi:hypothetical protein PQU95_15710 [Vogesella sp. DC21W]|uniref:Type II/III secretion system secretin-like domain-containing protein n=1 Tax=Vogesella aquatica TaxID=2984206 RepID=A0ABT5J1D9_9NEIS|nr:hypothetical protein [Vogesella aquatica]MDC7718649.1 hypothetical protein [Vogesella aquatica]